MANGVHRSRKRETYFGLFAFARAAHSAGSSRVRPPAPDPVSRADRREGGSELENTFLLLLLFSSPASPPPAPPPLAFSHSPLPLLPRLLLLPHNLKKEGAARQLPSSGGIRSRCQFTTRGAANAKHGGRGGLNTAAAKPNNTAARRAARLGPRGREQPTERAAERAPGLRPPPQLPRRGQVEPRARRAGAPSAEVASDLASPACLVRARPPRSGTLAPRLL